MGGRGDHRATPKGRLSTVASRRWIARWRQEVARRRREQTAAALAPPQPELVPAVDDTLTLLLLCCDPSLRPVLPGQRLFMNGSMAAAHGIGGSG
jgi:hypothetical protein